jgi:predicted GTPase
LSIIGPFSSGKSLILNTLFGTEYISGSGRCTRGVYGSLIDIKTGIKKSNFKKILILDSEGTECKEATDDTFDKRIIFYMLSVSHIVLICNKGEMKNDMERTIKLAADSIMKVREMIDQQPEVHIIMNDVDLKGDKGLAATI